MFITFNQLNGKKLKIQLFLCNQNRCFKDDHVRHTEPCGGGGAAHLPSSHMIAMAARTIRSLSCSPSVPTAIREFVIEVGNSAALMVMILVRTGKRQFSSSRGKQAPGTHQDV